MADIIKQLNEKESTIRDLQQKKARQDGQKQQLFEQLKGEFNIDSLDDAVTELENTQTEIEKNDAEIQKLDLQMADIISKAQGSN